MPPTLRPAVAAALRGLPPAEGRAAAWALAAARRLPAALAFHFRFGCPLDGEADAAFVLKVAPAGAAALVRDPPRGAGWAAAADFCAAWADPSSALHDAVAGLWLRLGRDGGPRHAFFFLAAPPAAGGAGGWVPADALPRLAGGPPAPAAARALMAAADALAPHARPLQAGVRADGTLTLGVHPSPGTLLAGLRAAGWSGDADEAERLARLTDGLGGQLCATLHVRDAVEPALDLEHHLNGVREPDRSFAWAELLGRLRDAGLCTTEHRRALAGFGGAAREGERMVSRGLGHLEVALRPGRPARARAYLACTLRPAAAGAA